MSHRSILILWRESIEPVGDLNRPLPALLFGANMPIPKRYFHISQEINYDPELWTFTQEFGDRSLRTWLQILSYLDRSQNRWRVSGDWVATLSRTVRQSSASVSRQVGWLLANRWLVSGEQSAANPGTVYSSPNWSKYNRSQEHKRSGVTPDMGAVDDPLLSYPILSVPIPSVPTPKIKEKKEIKSVAEVPAERSTLPKSSVIWEAYRNAYRGRYGVDPVRNRSVNIGLCQVIDKLGAQDAPHVADYYLSHNGQWYVTKMHPVNLLVVDAEKLRTEWATGRQVTATQARQVDGKESRGQVWTELLEEFSHKETA